MKNNGIDKRFSHGDNGNNLLLSYCFYSELKKMKQKKYTKAEKIKICKAAILAEKKGTSLFKHSKEISVSDVSLYSWVRKFRAGTLNGTPGAKEEIEIPSSLISDMTEEFNNTGSVKTEMVEVLVFSESVENSIRVSVEEPDTTDVEKYSNEFNQRILDKLQWCFAVKGFKF